MSFIKRKPSKVFIWIVIWVANRIFFGMLFVLSIVLFGANAFTYILACCCEVAWILTSIHYVRLWNRRKERHEFRLFQKELKKTIPKDIRDKCDELFSNQTELKKYINSLLQTNVIDQKGYDMLFEEYVED